MFKFYKQLRKRLSKQIVGTLPEAPYTIKLDTYSGIVSIGCKHYRASRLLKSAKVFLKTDSLCHSVFQKNIGKIEHGSFSISLKDVNYIVHFLKTNGVR